jgi:transposase-like protein
MGRPRNPLNPPCARCGAVLTLSKGTQRGRQRWRCLACGRTFGVTLGTPLYRLKTDPAEIIRALKIVLHRGSLRAAEEQTGHNYETITAWLERMGEHADAITDRLARELNLSEVELDELWSFVGQKGGIRRRESKETSANRKAPANDGAASASIARAASSWPGRADHARRL